MEMCDKKFFFCARLLLSRSLYSLWSAPKRNGWRAWIIHVMKLIVFIIHFCCRFKCFFPPVSRVFFSGRKTVHMLAFGVFWRVHARRLFPTSKKIDYPEDESRKSGQNVLKYLMRRTMQNFTHINSPFPRLMLRSIKPRRIPRLCAISMLYELIATHSSKVAVCGASASDTLNKCNVPKWQW